MSNLNQGGYWVSGYSVIVLCLLYVLYKGEIERELREDNFDIQLPCLSFGLFKDLFIFCKLFNIPILFSTNTFDLRAKAKTTLEDFSRHCKVEYRGKHSILLSNISGVLHPVDNFIKHFYDRFFPKQCVAAFAKYKRTNPTLGLRLTQLDKFAEPHADTIPTDELDAAIETILTDVFSAHWFSTLRMDLSVSINEMDFDSLVLDGASAAGYPFKQGSKRRDVRHDATQVAREILHDDHAFESYSNDHVWYTTGRAKMQSILKENAGRLIMYAGFSFMLIGMLVCQIWSTFMNSFEWCGVGFSWMHGGAGKFAHLFEADKGYAPKGFRYVSLDIKEWDTKLHHDIMCMLKKFYSRLLDKCGISRLFTDKFILIIDDMINAVVLFPMGYIFKVSQGMKSGWCNTANDNTLLHEVVFRCIMKRLCYMKHVLYGDDNFILVPDSVTDQMLKDEYARFGLVIGAIHSSRYLGDVDFLSKYVVYSMGVYYVFRPSVETHSRLLMPEELDPRRRDRPDAVIGVERTLGHLLDNPFNEDVRHTCYSILHRLKKHYAIDYIDVHDSMFRSHPWSSFDKDMIPKRFPTIPSLTFIEELYGVPIPHALRVAWPCRPDFVGFSRETASDSLRYDVACEYSNDVAFKLGNIAGKKAKAVIRRISPYAQPKFCYGFHAARFEFALRYFGIQFSSMLDFGAHPGACAASALKHCADVVCVSKKPRGDEDFCPYVARCEDVKLIRTDADHFVPFRRFELLHDDVDVRGGSVADDILNGLGIIRRAA